ncbi:hypothetical protein AMV036 [Betaentomopoxvirus amoorei]|uniref:AMV036 n=1 Tax=Amsacta moorei entomopoxvirus TaxID=28321 RepID=Q9EN12_AMEPV|nr:hypothetical protein AMV036 [Amsacta moorei entomopoxvirus]AAG02742.1 AMV036 [Amsacta moorei entomopoxvirus]
MIQYLIYYYCKLLLLLTQILYLNFRYLYYIQTMNNYFLMLYCQLIIDNLVKKHTLYTNILLEHLIYFVYL